MGIFSSIKKGVSDALAVGQQVVGMTLDAGASVLNGAKTLITDPKKFVEDVATNVSEAGRHAVNSATSGAQMIGEGWNEAWATGNPGMFLWKAVGGTVQMASLGVTDAIKEHIEDVAEVKRDELGNITGFEATEDCDAITRIALERTGGWAAKIANGDAEVKEAIAEGDIDKANEVFGQTVTQAVVKPVGEAAGKVAIAAGATALVIGTGGAALPGVAAAAAAAGITAGGAAAVATVGGVTSVVSNAVGDKTGVDFSIGDQLDDVTDKVASEIAALTKAGVLDDADKDKYSEVMTNYYQMVYGDSSDALAAAYMGEGYTNADLKAATLSAAGLPNYDNLVETGVIQVDGPMDSFAPDVDGEPIGPDFGDELIHSDSAPSEMKAQAPADHAALAAAIQGMSAEDQAAISAFIAMRAGASAGLQAAVLAADDDQPINAHEQAEQPAMDDTELGYYDPLEQPTEETGPEFA